MDSRFDGLRSILGNAAVATPEAEAPAAASTRVAAPVANTAVDLPDLSDLDRGLDDAKHSAAPTDRADTFVALARGTNREESDESLELDESVFGALPPPTVQQRATARAADVRTFPRSQRQEVVVSERGVSGWTAVAVMALGLFLGGTAAMAVFHNDLARILARLQ
jgi:hypothetical protein